MSQSGFSYAIIARHQIAFLAPGITVDSYDSRDSMLSTAGQYDPAKAGDRGDLLSNSSASTAVSLGDAKVFGRVYVGVAGGVSLGTNGAVGSHLWQLDNQGIEPYWIVTNANFNFPDTSLPYTNGLVPGPGEIVVCNWITNHAVYQHVSTLPQLQENQTLGPVTTNTVYYSTFVYPGPFPGLVTNMAWVTTSAYPGDVSGLTTNCVGFVSVTNDPGSQPCLSSNALGTVTATNYPGPVAGLTTNTLVTINGTNVVVIISSNAVCGTAIYSGSSLPTNCCSYTMQGGGGGIQNYKYTLIDHYTYWYSTNFTYTYATNYSYTYPAFSWTYASQFTYTYLEASYFYTGYTYSFTLYSATQACSTNVYDHLLLTGDYYTTNLLSGQTYVSGSARLVAANGLEMSGLDQITIGTNASLKLYAGGTQCRLNADGVLNASGSAAGLALVCTREVTSVRVEGSGSFLGLMVAPNARVTIQPYALLDFCGLVVADSVVVNGQTRFHADRALQIFQALPAASLESMQTSAAGQFMFIVFGSTALPYVIEASTNLVDWEAVFTNHPPFIFVDTDPNAHEQRFYRAVCSP